MRLAMNPSTLLSALCLLAIWSCSQEPGITLNELRHEAVSASEGPEDVTIFKLGTEQQGETITELLAGLKREEFPRGGVACVEFATSTSPVRLFLPDSYGIDEDLWTVLVDNNPKIFADVTVASTSTSPFDISDIDYDRDDIASFSWLGRSALATLALVLRQGTAG